MNRYIQILYLFFLSTGACIAQVGIKTERPIKILNIDVLGNNPLINPQSSDKLKDDLIFRLNTNSEANLIIGGGELSRENEASLELNDPNKALLLNRVPLKSTSDISTVASPRDGMVLYNTSTDGTSKDAVTPGVYMNISRKWVRLADKENKAPGEASNIRNLSADTSSGLLTNVSTGVGANKLNIFGGDIVVPDAGRYFFVFRLYGPMIRGLQYGDYFLYLFKKNNSGAEELLNKVEMVVIKTSNSTFATYSPMMSTSFLEEGDIITIKIGHQSGPVWTLRADSKTVANRTSFVYWKIE